MGARRRGWDTGYLELVWMRTTANETAECHGCCNCERHHGGSRTATDTAPANHGRPRTFTANARIRQLQLIGKSSAGFRLGQRDSINIGLPLGMLFVGSCPSSQRLPLPSSCRCPAVAVAQQLPL